MIVLVDHNRSVDVAVFGEKNGCFTPKNIYCMGWWERNPNDKRFKYKFKNGQTFLLENNLTAYKYGRQKFLGFNTSLLFSKITKKNSQIFIKIPSGECLQLEMLKEYNCDTAAPFHRTLFSKKGIENFKLIHLGLTD